MTFWCVVSSSCLTVPLSNFLCNGPHIVIPTSQNCSHTKFSRKLLLSFFFKSSALRELCPFQKSLERLRVCARDGLKSSPSRGVTHCSTCIPMQRQQLYITVPNGQTAAVNLLAFYTYFSQVQTAKNWAFHHFQFL